MLGMRHESNAAPRARPKSTSGRAALIRDGRFTRCTYVVRSWKQMPRSASFQSPVIGQLVIRGVKTRNLRRLAAMTSLVAVSPADIVAVASRTFGVAHASPAACSSGRVRTRDPQSAGLLAVGTSDRSQAKLKIDRLSVDTRYAAVDRSNWAVFVSVPSLAAPSQLVHEDLGGFRNGPSDWPYSPSYLQSQAYVGCLLACWA
ncbi:hypothetical protein B0J12DRAFT_704581 [Macrophomina phaseolina]|uniref:Uncharacterized protein n=1 Tax=Macrophomina phaseolina TaxID=35725 RepID=A0ABQ8FXA5_9PEZI|nr:hypothetical protein B0J12DRAFT_704581 [Macrophomina phaseolina]